MPIKKISKSGQNTKIIKEEDNDIEVNSENKEKDKDPDQERKDFFHIDVNDIDKKEKYSFHRNYIKRKNKSVQKRTSHFLDEEEEEEEEFIEEEEEEEFSEEEDKTDIVEIKLKHLKIKTNYSILTKYLHLVREKYLISDISTSFSSAIKQLQSKHNLKNYNIQLFFKSLGNSYVYISNNNYYDLKKLAKFLKAQQFLKRLQNYKSLHGKEISFMINSTLAKFSAKKNDNDFSLAYNHIITENVNLCLKNNRFTSLHINLIYKVLKHANEQVDNDLLLDFICESIRKRYTLLEFIDFQNLSDRKCRQICNSVKNSTNHHLMYIHNIVSYILSMREKLKLKQDEIDRLTETKEIQI